MTGEAIAAMRAMLARLEAREPIRLIIGYRFYDAGELVMTDGWQARLRRLLGAELRREIAALETPPDGPAAPAAGGTAPPSVLPDIAPRGGEMGSVAVAPVPHGEPVESRGAAAGGIF